MKVINILGNNANVKPLLLQGSQRLMGRVGLGTTYLFTTLVIKIQHLLRIAPPRLRGGDIFNRMVLP